MPTPESEPATKKAVTAKKAAKKSAAKKSPKKKTTRVDRPYPRTTLEEAIGIPMSIRQKNGGNPWEPAEIAKAVGRSSHKSNDFFYQSAASRDYGLTNGTRDAAQIELTDLGRRLAYAETLEQERETRLEAFYKIEIFKNVLEYYDGNNLPEMKYLKNTLENKFGLAPSIHEEFAELFRKNCEYLNLTQGAKHKAGQNNKAASNNLAIASDFVTVAEPENDTGLLCFVAMPFSEKTDKYPTGFFTEVLKQLIAPAARDAGFRVVTATKKGSDVIHATIINGLLDADLVVVDLTEHNPNVLFELGVRMAEDKPIALIRATGTAPIFDVDNMLRVEHYNPNLWPSTVENDLPRLASHIKGSWDDRENTNTFMKILRDKKAET
ncbi:hypothetical protein OAG68_02535 [bacterium]|nr:hypothetical protein [bacterium]